MIEFINEKFPGSFAKLNIEPSLFGESD